MLMIETLLLISFQKIMGSSVTGNILGGISILVSICTFLMTRDNSRKIDEIKLDAVNKNDFLNAKHELINSLKKLSEEISQLKIITNKEYNILLRIIGEISLHQTTFSGEDNKKVSMILQRNKYRSALISSIDSSIKEAYQADLICDINDLLNIVNKGVYIL